MPTTAPEFSLCRPARTGAASILVAALAAPAIAAAGPPPDAATATAAKQALAERHGAAEAGRIGRGVDAVLTTWRPEDGDAAAFRAFVDAEYLPEGELRDATFARLEFVFERVDGLYTSMVRDLRRGVDLEIGPLLPLDRRLGGFDPSAHLGEDLFANRLAFTVLLNFPPATLAERLRDGDGWSRRQWAETRLGERFATRTPAEVRQAIAAALGSADTYISGYNVYLHHLLTEDGRRLFPPGLRLISHWGLRDELKARYTDPEGLARQRMIATVMDRIVRQRIPAAVVDNPLLDWTPATGAVAVSPVADAPPPPGRTAEPSTVREDDERYRRWLEIFRAQRLGDPYSPAEPTYIDRRFHVDREIPEAEVAALFEAVLAAPAGAEVARAIERRLGRPLEPFDVWYAGFKPRGKFPEAELDAATRARYPTADAYAADIPRLLAGLGFSAERAAMLAGMIVVEPSRGAGHAFGAARRDDKAHLRTRVGAAGMDYKGYNIAVHEMGHNVEQVFSMTLIDHTLLQGVPNTAFTEAMAFVFQARDLELLGLAGRDRETERLAALDTFWATREIAGVALVDMAAWRWLYAHPEATPAEFREAVVGIAQDVWNRHYAHLLGARDQVLLAIYSHMVDGSLYTPDYPLGHLIAFQVEEHFRTLDRPLGEEFERITRLGRLTPDAWMRAAVGSPLSAEPLIHAAAAAVAAEPGAADRLAR